MGQVIGWNILAGDGSTRYSAADEITESFCSDERIEYIYEYGPHLLSFPSSPFAGMWRYSTMLPVTGNISYPLAIGGTPLTAPPRLREWLSGAALWIKDETRSPTNSNKDRATALVLEQALRAGVTTVTCASTGNVAVSLAVGAAACGIKAIIFVPASIAESKLKLMLFAGATVFKVEEGYDAAVHLSRMAAHEFGWYERNTGYNPVTLEGKKTVALELWEQFGQKFPAAVVVPVGDGVTLNGLAKGFRELIACGVKQPMPRLIAVQSEGCQPLVTCWKAQQATQGVPVGTLADGIAVSKPINATMALRDVKQSNGDFVAVSDHAILDAMTMLVERGGILAEPAGAAALAGVKVALEQNILTRDETVVALVTGSALKTPQYISPNRSSLVYTISAQISAVEHALS